MPLPLQFRLMAHNDTGLRNAREILIRNMRGGLEGLGKRLRNSAQARMREDRGKSKESLKVEIKGRGLGLRLEVYSQLIQAFVDAYGRPVGNFPPFRKGTRLYRWTERKSKGFESVPPKRGLGKTKRLSSSLSRRPVKVRRNKRVVDQTRNGPATLKQRLSARERSIEKRAFLVARHIFEHGIAPSHWNRKALEGNKSSIIRDMSNAISRAANEINKGG